MVPLVSLASARAFCPPARSCPALPERVAFALLAAVVIAGCAASASDSGAAQQATSTPLLAAPGDSERGVAPGKSGDGVKALCTPWTTHMAGAYRYENNQWGSEKAKGKFEQCLLTRELGGVQEVGWTWSWPGLDPSVFAYPEIVFGWKPWSGGKSTNARFPLQVSQVRQLVLSYEVETRASGSYNLAPEIWLTNSGATSSGPNPKSITTEVMFWMDYSSGARPAGTIVETPTLGGVTYELWKEDNIGKAANGQGWMLLSFKSPTIQHRGTIDIAQLLKHLVQAKLADPSHYVASVEFGNEVMGGSGTTWVKHFDVQVGD